MSDFNKKTFLLQIDNAQFSPDVQQSWNILEQGVMDYAKVKHQQRVDCSEPGSAFSDWWHACCELIAARQITIKDVNFDGSRLEGENDEYIEIFNNGPLIVDLTGWKINAGNEGQDMVFPQETLIYPKQSLRIYTDKEQALSFNSPQSVWNNKGDKAFLFDQNNELISSWCYGTKAHDDVEISHICFDGQEKFTEADEYAELTNLSTHWVDLSHWQLSAGKNQLFTFPVGTVLKPAAKVRIYTNYHDESTGGYSFNSRSAIWNNKGDSGTLTDHKHQPVSEYSYGITA